MGGNKQTNTRNTTAGLGAVFFLNIAFSIIELVGGLLTNSVAILSDALHDLGDSVSIGLAWALERVARKEKTAHYSYGYQRFSLLGALINGVVLVCGSVLIMMEALRRLFDPSPAYAPGMFVLAVVGIAVNGLAALRLREGGTLNLRLVSWHLIEDVLGWIGILLVSLTLLFWPIYSLDPLVSIAITLYILWNVAKNLRETLGVFFQGVPPSLSLKKIEASLCRIPGVLAVHDSHLWSLEGKTHILTTHVLISRRVSQARTLKIKCAAKERAARLGILHATIEIEMQGENCEVKPF